MTQLSLHRNTHSDALEAWSSIPLDSFKIDQDELYTLHSVCADAERIVFQNSSFITVYSLRPADVCMVHLPFGLLGLLC